jgi:hypothetical protein
MTTSVKHSVISTDPIELKHTAREIRKIQSNYLLHAHKILPIIQTYQREGVVRSKSEAARFS